MRSIYDLLQYRSLEQWSSIVGKAVRVAEEKPDAGWLVFQNELGLGMEEAFAIHDWLTDQYRAKPRLTTHWMRCGHISQQVRIVGACPKSESHQTAGGALGDDFHPDPSASAKADLSSLSRGSRSPRPSSLRMLLPLKQSQLHKLPRHQYFPVGLSPVRSGACTALIITP
jgi:hypothetical protein